MSAASFAASVREIQKREYILINYFAKIIERKGGFAQACAEKNETSIVQHTAVNRRVEYNYRSLINSLRDFTP